MRILLISLFFMPSASLALEYCDELWFTRNLVFHNGGHCFGSPLGKAVFGNEGCKEAGVELKAEEKAFIARVREQEAAESCKVDTKREALPVVMLEQRKGLVDLPFPTLYESACIGWLGDRVSLYTARDSQGEVAGGIRKGDTLLFQFEDVGDWSFVEVTQNGISASMGWAKVKFDEESCAMVAG